MRPALWRPEYRVALAIGFDNDHNRRSKGIRSKYQAARIHLFMLKILEYPATIAIIPDRAREADRHTQPRERNSRIRAGPAADDPWLDLTLVRW